MGTRRGLRWPWDPWRCDRIGSGSGSARPISSVAGTSKQYTITDGCGSLVWRIDVGLAAYYGGAAAVLEIVGDTVAILQ